MKACLSGQLQADVNVIARPVWKIQKNLSEFFGGDGFCFSKS
jgi:hypothetical protein